MNRIRVLFVLVVALLLTACASSGSYAYRDDGYRVCRACGVVERLERVEGRGGYASGSGALLGAIIGGALGNQVGKGDGRKAATIAGAVAGGVIGNEIEKEGDSGIWYEVFVRFDDGSRRVIRQRSRDGIREGDRVYVEGGRARLI
jgi:outer membrane lipoprotein SlyB